MNRHELEHLIRACGAITDEYEFVIVGSQSLSGQFPYPEPFFKMSAEADIYPRHAPDLADKIDGGIGEGSEFHPNNATTRKALARIRPSFLEGGRREAEQGPERQYR